MGSREPARLVGREAERRRLEALLGEARNGDGGCLLMVGDPGVGKTSLLEGAVVAARGLSVSQVTCCDVESAMPYAALQRLVGAMKGHLPALPSSHREALTVALGHGEGPPPQRALVALAVLGLVAAASEEEPWLLAVDDAHLLDAESAEVLGIVGRRLGAESVALLVASRPHQATHAAFAGIDAVTVDPLGPDAATELLRGLVEGPLDADVARAVVRDTAGNPLALCEVAREWDGHGLTRLTLAGSPGPVGDQLERHFSALAGSLSPDAQTWLLVAAAESSGDLAVIRAAASALDAAPGAEAEVERAGLVRIREAAHLRHPLARAAIYGAASDSDRRDVHGALRDYYARVGRRDLSVQHAAAASAGPDDAIAGALRELAEDAAQRGAQVTRARLLASAAALSARPAARASCLIDAAQAAVSSGHPHLALELIADVDSATLDAVASARLLIVTTRCALFLSSLANADEVIAEVLDAADAVAGEAPGLERTLLLFAFELLQVTLAPGVLARLEGFGARLRAARDPGDDAWGLVLAAIAAFILDDYAEAVPALERARIALENLDDAALIDTSSYLVVPALGLWDADGAVAMLERAASSARRLGALRELDAILWTHSTVEMSRGCPSAARRLLVQVEGIRQALGYAEVLAVNPAVLAWTGVPRAHIEPMEAVLDGMGFGGVVRISRAHCAVADIAAGEYAAALPVLLEVLDTPFLQASLPQLSDAVEAAVRSDRPEVARRLADHLAAHADACGRPWARALAARAAALVTDGPDAEPLYAEAIASIDATGLTGEQGRTRLLYGEWLRRRGRRLDAARELTRAHEILTECGATVFAERARRELAAAGMAAPRRGPRNPREDLTAREAAIAALAAKGRTNAEIGARLFISANTVDYHLRKVFRKMGVTSRRQLADALADQGADGT
ncbi:LuxR family transcriptional regulator [Demequina sp. NBRC 110057]|uniref:helix-turn-helix transcriptional regulator n=1 Tax=Demequina sp. NBRC 110057 TaxID=1570346 RepID=UPI0009FC905A|nr:AAA family ATPase [Demequina sp. NBRC 110057]